jgi:hypothetical protein
MDKFWKLYIIARKKAIKKRAKIDQENGSRFKQMALAWVKMG